MDKEKNNKKEKWETIIDFTKIKKGGIKAKDLLTKLESIKSDD